MSSESSDFDKLIAIIQKKKKKGQNEYHFRPYAIDGVYCYIVLYFKFSILTVESVNIKCEYSYQGKMFNQPYVLYFRKYKSVKDAFELIQKITTKYKILNGDLESPENYAELKLEDCILPYKEDEHCSVCFENTTDTTVCDHPICLNCREKCILKKQYNCPICRNVNIMHLYNNRLQLFNNRDSNELHRIFINDSYKYSFHADEEESGSESEEEESESESDEEENAMDVEEPEPRVVDAVNIIVNDIFMDE